MEILVFNWIDYVLFTSLLGISLFIGLYVGFCSNQDSVSEYLFGGKTMGYFPVAISILASTFSGIMILGIPTEVYLYGSIYFYDIFEIIAASVFTAYITIPIFFELQVVSSYDYLEMRFSKTVKNYASILYTLSLFIYMPIVVYGPAIAFSQATGYSLHMIASVVCIICITYTTIGGVKAVIWTDTLQFIFTIGGIFTVLVAGLNSLGGFSNMWHISSEGGRIELNNFNLSPFERNTFWTMTVGTFFVNLSYGAVGQKFVQRYLSIKKLEDIRKAIWVTMLGLVLMLTCIIFTGLAMYAHYHDCDPISAKRVKHNDQIFAYYVLEITRNLPGVPGIFLASITSSALSTMSASINSLAGIIYDNFIACWISESANTDTRAATVMKVISVIIGTVSIGLIFVLEYMGTIFAMSFSIRGALEGPLLGFFLAGMLVPWIGNIGALTGGTVSFILMLWITVGAKWHSINKRIHDSYLPLSTENCTRYFNGTVIENIAQSPVDPSEEPLVIFRLSFLYITFVGSMLTVIVGLIVSAIMKESDLSKIDSDHITPLMRRFLPRKKYEEVPLRKFSRKNRRDNQK